MIRIFVFWFLLLPFCVQAKGVSLELNRVPLPEAIHLLYSEVFSRPYMLAPELANDSRVVSLRITPDIDERAFITRYFGNMNIRIHARDGIDYVAPVAKATQQEKQEVFVYHPQYRSVAYLSDILRTFVDGQFNASGGIGGSDSLLPEQVKPGSATDNINRSGDVLVFYGTAENIRKIKRVLPEIDSAGDEVFIAGYVFEVQTSERNGSGLALAAKLLGGKIEIGMGNMSGGYENFIRIGGSSLDAMYELFRTDSRFNVVSSPRLRVKSGYSATFSVGQEVPVLSGIDRNQTSTYQSVDYRSAGVILDVTPSVRNSVTDLKISQQLSNFIKTDTGVNDTPTLIKREVSTVVSVKSGDIVVLGGLAETKDSDARTGLSFLPRAFGSRSDEKSKTDILIVLQVRTAKAA